VAWRTDDASCTTYLLPTACYYLHKTSNSFGSSTGRLAVSGNISLTAWNARRVPSSWPLELRRLY